VPELRRRSPLEAALSHGSDPEAAPGAPGVVITERRGLAIVQVIARGGQDQAVSERLGLDPTPGRASATPAGAALWLAPGAWLVVAEEIEEGALYQNLLEPLGDLAAVVDQSHGRAALRLSGTRARDMLAKGCRLDLHPRVFTPGMCAQTVIAQIGVLLHQCDEIPTYDLYVPAGYALDSLEWLTSSAAEFGFRTDVARPQCLFGTARLKRNRRASVRAQG
jgi:heterotetrameric sarcosine oxidase gamma subunit